MSVRIHAQSSQLTNAAHHFSVFFEGTEVIATLTATQIGTSRVWFADIPASVVTPGKYHAYLYRTSNGRPRGGPASFYWDGADIIETEATELDAADIEAAVISALDAQGYTSARALLLDNLDAAVSTVGGGSLTVADIVNGVWDEAAASHIAPGSMGELQTSGGGGAASAGVIADAIWDELLAGHTVAGSTGEALAAIFATAGNHTTEMNFHNWLDTYSNKQDWMADLSILPTALQIASAVWAHATRSLTDKTGFELSAAERLAIATAVEAAIINEGDGQQVVDAIVQAINSDLDINGLELAAIANAVRTELATELARIDVDISSRESEAAAAARDANMQIEHDATQAAIAALNFPGLTPAQAEAAAIAALTTYNAATSADIAGIAALIAGLNNLSALDIVTILDAQGLTTAAVAVLNDLQTETDAAARFATLTAEHDDTQNLINALENLSLTQVSVLLSSLGLSADTITDTILDEPIAAHAIAGSVGEAITQAASGGFVAGDIHTALDSYTNKDDWKADIATLPTAVQIATAVWASANRTLTGDLPVSPANLTLIANAVQAGIINEGDGQQVVDAIVNAINASFDLSGVELAAIGTAVRTELATELARLDVDVSSRESTVDAAAREANILAAIGSLTTLITSSPNCVTEMVTAGLAVESAPGVFEFTAAALANGPVGLTTAQQAQLLELWQRMGLDASNPVTYTDTSIAFNGVTLNITCPNPSTTVVTRP